MFKDLFAEYQSLEPYDEEVDFFYFLLFPEHRILLLVEIFQQMPVQQHWLPSIRLHNRLLIQRQVH